MKVRNSLHILWRNVFLFLMFSISVAGCTRLQPKPDKNSNEILPVIAVTSFENRSGFEGQWRLGDGMSDLLVSELVATKKFNVVEREQFGRIVEEIERQRNPLFRPEGRTQIGRLKGAHLQIRGVINDFSQGGGSSFYVAMRKLVFGGRGYTARVSMTLVLIEVESGQILDSVQSSGTARARQAYLASSYKDVAFGGDVFFRTPLGVATREAIEDGVKAIMKAMPKEHWKPMIATVQGRSVIINGGADRCIKVGQMFIVRRPAEPVTDPGTGDVLDYLPGAKLGTIRVISVGEKLSQAVVIDGSNFSRGQPLESVP